MTDGDRTASTVVVSFEPDDSRTASELDGHAYRSYLRRAREGPVADGDVWGEFVSCGCGTTRAVTLRVESVRGGATIGAETTFVFEPAGR